MTERTALGWDSPNARTDEARTHEQMPPEIHLATNANQRSLRVASDPGACLAGRAE
jgi:hypothetical protein